MRRMLPPAAVTAAVTASLFALPMMAKAAEAPKVVASIQPLESIAIAVMDGVGEPTVLLPPGTSPHHAALRPSQARSLQDADVVFWIGATLESFLERPLDSLSGGADAAPLITAKGLSLLKVREGDGFETHDHAHGHDEHGHDDHDGHDDHAEHMGEMDPHFWLDPRNGIVIAKVMAERLAAVDPAHADAYRANAEAFAAEMSEVEAEIDAMLAPVRDKPFIVFHDAYQYFESRFGMAAAGAITLSPETPPGAARIAEIRETITSARAACAFTEPQFSDAIVASVLDGTDAGTALMDPIGAGGAGGYADMFRANAKAVAECLAG